MPRRLFLLVLALFCVSSTLGLLAPALPTLRAEFSLSYTAVGAFGAVYNLTRLAASLVFGFDPRRMAGARPVFFAGGCFAAGALLALVSSSYLALIVAIGAMGLASSIFNTILLYAISLLAPPEKRATVMSYYQGTWNLASAAYPAVGGLITYLAGWRWNLVLMLVGVAVSTCLSWLAWGRFALPSESAAEEAAERNGPRQSWRAIWLPLLAVYGVVVVWFVNRMGFRTTLLPLYAEQALALDAAQIGLGLGVLNAVGTVIIVPGAMLADRFGQLTVLLPGLALMALGIVAFLLVGDYAGFLVAASVAGLADVLGGTQTALLLNLSLPSQRRLVISYYRIVSDASSAAAPVLVGVFLDFIGAEGAIWSLAAMPVLAGIAAWAAIRGRPAHRAGLSGR